MYGVGMSYLKVIDIQRFKKYTTYYVPVKTVKYF
jgi:hypothetical protein